MSDPFPACLAVTLAWEGVRSDDPRDPGGRTDRGITQRTFTAWLAARHQPARDVFSITQAEVEAIYRGAYWEHAGCGALPAGLDLMHFDAAVNSGPAQAARWLAKTRTFAARSDQIQAYAGARLSFLRALRTWTAFGTGWSRRVADVEAKALRLAMGDTPAASHVIAAKAKTQAAVSSVAAAARTASSVAVGGAVMGAATTPHLATSLGSAALLFAAAIVSALVRARSNARAAALAHTASP